MTTTTTTERVRRSATEKEKVYWEADRSERCSVVLLRCQHEHGETERSGDERFDEHALGEVDPFGQRRAAVDRDGRVGYLRKA